MAESAGVAMPGLRRAWLRELGLEHLWVSPGGGIRVGQPGAGMPGAHADGPGEAPAAMTLPDGHEPPAGREPASAVRDDAATQSQPAAASASMPTPASVPGPRELPAVSSEQSVDAASHEPSADAMPGEPASDAVPREPATDAGVREGLSASAAPRAEPAAGAQRAATGWMAWDVPPASEGGPAWMVLAKAEDAGAPAAQALLQAMLRAVGRRAVALTPGQRGDQSARPAALIAVGAAARAALGCAEQPWMQLGEGRWKGEPIRVLALPPLADIGAGAQVKAPAWRALLRLDAAG
ncbi:hypothetical protein FOZ76_21035 [Verticiella sediminum]|uniref:Uncharacterized protein n=1 Tax=Verticiella sediminum TaxID=1247510 RepID=A0A556ABP5_9BURK|nr:hypothetical protein [Verticiella sediminum]TSH90314.1 hypothetical protein FOZ76_21035 [Verticiella sediminum]